MQQNQVVWDSNPVHAAFLPPLTFLGLDFVPFLEYDRLLLHLADSIMW